MPRQDITIGHGDIDVTRDLARAHIESSERHRNYLYNCGQSAISASGGKVEQGIDILVMENHVILGSILAELKILNEGLTAVNTSFHQADNSLAGILGG